MKKIDFAKKDLIKLIPVGISLNLDPSRPVLLLKDEKGQHVLPVAVNPLEAGIALGQNSKSLEAAQATPHKLMQLLLESLSIKIQRCVFVEIRGQYQYVRVYFEGHPSHGSLKVRADEAMSLCLQLNVPLFATAKLMEKSKIMSAEIQELSQVVAKSPSLRNKNSEYLM